MWNRTWEVFLCAAWDLKKAPEILFIYLFILLSDRVESVSVLIHLLPWACSCAELSFNGSQAKEEGVRKTSASHLE